MNRSLDSLFHPHSLAVIGVSRDYNAVGSCIYRNIIEEKFNGSVFPVNPFIQTYNGEVCYPSVLVIPQSVDIAVVVVPATIVPSVMEEIGKKHIQTAIIISAGFGETGIEGKALEYRIQEIAHTYKITVLGPNCLGLIHPKDHINISFARTKPISGSIAFLSQSGALGTAILDIVTPKSIGFSHFISLGNKIDVSELDVLEYLIKDEETTVIGMYIEQLSDAKRCIDIGRRIASNSKPKPIIVLKGGQTKKGTDAVHSHTGSLAGLPESYRALFKQSCMLETCSTQEFINTLVAFSENPIPKGNGAAIVTNAGGPAILATDTLTSRSVIIPDIPGKHNPIDLLGDAKALDFEKTLSFLEKNDSVNSILSIVTPQTMTDIDNTANAFCIHKKHSLKPLTVCFMGDQMMKTGKQILDLGHVPSSKYPEQAAAMLANLHVYASLRERILHSQYYTQPKQIHSLLPMDAYDPLSSIRSIGISVPPYVITKNIPTDSSILSCLGNLLAIKIISPQIIHKSDVGAVSLNIPKERAIEKVKEMMEDIKKHNICIVPPYTILFMNMVDTTQSLECIVGLKKEPGLGTLVMLGLGGIYVEILKDVVFRFVPISESDAKEMVTELQFFRIFEGVRGRKALDVDELINTLLLISQIASEKPEIEEMDINPLLVGPRGSGVLALDCRITLKDQKAPQILPGDV